MVYRDILENRKHKNVYKNRFIKKYVLMESDEVHIGRVTVIIHGNSHYFYFDAVEGVQIDYIEKGGG
jgi:hypothetical protein